MNDFHRESLSLPEYKEKVLSDGPATGVANLLYWMPIILAWPRLQINRFLPAASATLHGLYSHWFVTMVQPNMLMINSKTDLHISEYGLRIYIILHANTHVNGSHIMTDFRRSSLPKTFSALGSLLNYVHYLFWCSGDFVIIVWATKWINKISKYGNDSIFMYSRIQVYSISRFRYWIKYSLFAG